MTVAGHDIIHNCRRCFSDNGYGMRLVEENGVFVCKHDRTHRYVLKDGFMEKA